MHGGGRPHHPSLGAAHPAAGEPIQPLLLCKDRGLHCLDIRCLWAELCKHVHVATDHATEQAAGRHQHLQTEQLPSMQSFAS